MSEGVNFEWEKDRMNDWLNFEWEKDRMNECWMIEC
jgi:hypothetical protein